MFWFVKTESDGKYSIKRPAEIKSDTEDDLDIYLMVASLQQKHTLTVSLQNANANTALSFEVIKHVEGIPDSRSLGFA